MKLHHKHSKDNHMKNHIIIIVLFLAQFISLPIIAQTINVRPVTIKVMDASNGQPITNVMIYYGFYVFQRAHLFFIPLPETQACVYKECNKYITNTNGMILLSAKLKLKWYERIIDECIWINLDFPTNIPYYFDYNKKMSEAYNFAQYYSTFCYEKGKYFSNPNKKYRGYVVNSSYKDYPKADQLPTKGEQYDILRNWCGLTNEQEYIEVKLEQNKK